jgi:hypothetical protein
MLVMISHSEFIIFFYLEEIINMIRISLVISGTVLML